MTPVAERTLDLLRRRNRALAARSNTTADLVADIDRHGRGRREGIRARVITLLQALASDRREPLPEDLSALATGELVHRLLAEMTPLTPERAWLLLAVLDGRLPDVDQVQAAVRAAVVDGPVAAIRLGIWSGPLPRILDQGPFREVRVITGQVVVDVHHTAQTDFATGIQRVTREVVKRWLPAHRPVPIGWTADYRSLRRLTPREIRRACWGGDPVPVPTDDPIVVPWKCTYIVPELAAEPERSAALQALARFSGGSYNAIGYDLVPVTTAETAQAGMLNAFARGLSAIRHARVVVPISNASGIEYGGWRRMLAGTGLPGPAIVVTPLATEVPAVDPTATAAAAKRFGLGNLPLVLVVGSHEPRKNHLAVLHAAELLWREGRRFSLTFIGGNAWNSERFTARLARLQELGRPVETVAAATDAALFGGYRAARFTVFPSLNEGFGLPVAESLGLGTPVITSRFGSMKEIVEDGGGGLLVDPRDDHSIADAMRTLLTDDELLQRLRSEAQARTTKTWDEYAQQTWRVLAFGPDGQDATDDVASRAGLVAAAVVDSNSRS